MRRLVVVLACALWPASAGATNGFRPRTSPTFEREQCLTVVGRDAPVVRVDYSIPFEDAQLTRDELPDSRTLQFVALCEDRHAELEPLPNWMGQGDVDRALAAGVLEDQPAPGDVLDTASAWENCAWRLNADDARVPITCAATEGAIEFDTRALAAGNYVLRGYTFEPALNVWVHRRGVVQVRDDDQPLPAVGLMSPPRDDWQAYEADGFDVVGCIAGPPETVVRLEWASLIALQWQPWTTLAVADSDGDFELHFDFPPEAVGQPLLFRAIAEAPGSPSWTAYAPGTLLVLPGDGETDEPEPPPGLDFCGFYPDEGSGSESGIDASTSSASGTGTGTGTGSETGDAAAVADLDGCGCTQRRGGAALSWALVLLAIPWPRRRRPRTASDRPSRS